MSKAVKAMITEELKARFAEVESACVVSLSGLSIEAQESIRGKLREKSARVEVVKNCLARRAFRQTPLEPLGDALTGPCAVVTTSESLIDAARVLVDAAGEFEGFSLKHAILDGDPDLLTVEDLARMKGRGELLADISMLIASPGRAIAGCLSAPQGKIAGCLKAMIEKAEAA